MIDDILSFLLLKLSPAEMLELIQLMAKDKDVVEFLIKKRCKEIGVMDKTKKEDIKEKKLSEGDINLNDWW
ncbi:MAG: hypothetical protein DSY59_00880 [Persephonella sp.]|nr:MAG: hypothetical protein DSY60_01115 [Persephonella sp.]RUM62065.1 MAG: hypothetical protein DSY59_00880 [Persephonella sp.]